MKWTFHPANEELTTSLPLSVDVKDWRGKPRLFVRQIGELELKSIGENHLRADFYLTLPGKYDIEIRDQGKIIHHEILIKQHNYLDFKNEFGFFFFLFLFVMGGIIIWTRKIMQKKIA